MQKEQTASKLILELNKQKDSKKSKVLSGFFKTGTGQYGEGDIFLGIKVPVQRKVCSNYNLSLKEIQKLLNSKIHEHRTSALFILVKRYEKATKEKNETERKEIFDFYLSNAHDGNINNWDLVDLSAPNIVGNYLLDKKNERKLLYALAKSTNLWEKRISILATFSFIKNKETTDTIEISKILLTDKHDLIHKSVGWMLREMGKRASEKVLLLFLDQHATKMPRTMLRYAIERLSERQRKLYLFKK